MRKQAANWFLLFFVMQLNAMDSGLGLSHFPLTQTITESINYSFIDAIRTNQQFSAKIFKILGADVNMRDSLGNTPLHRAAEQGDIEIFKWLISCGANLQATKNDGMNAFILAAAKGHSAIVSYCLAHGQLVNQLCKKKRTALIYAVKYVRLAVAQKLIEHGANVNLGDSDGRTALHHCAKVCVPSRQIKKLARILVRAGANIDQKDYNDSTPLMYAAQSASPIVSTLLDCGADQFVKDKNGMTAFLHACAIGHIGPMAELLISAQDKIVLAQQNKCGHSASIIALHGSDEVQNFIDDAQVRTAVIEDHRQKKVQSYATGTNIFYRLRDRDLGRPLPTLE